MPMEVYRSGRQEVEPPPADTCTNLGISRRCCQSRLQEALWRNQGSPGGQSGSNTVHRDNMKANTHTWEPFMSQRFTIVTSLMCANSFCGQKDCYYVPRWVHGQMMFTQLQRNHVKIFLPNKWFQLVLVFLQQQPNRLFHTGIWLFKYLHVIMTN